MPRYSDKTDLDDAMLGQLEGQIRAIADQIQQHRQTMQTNHIDQIQVLMWLTALEGITDLTKFAGKLSESVIESLTPKLPTEKRRTKTKT